MAFGQSLVHELADLDVGQVGEHAGHWHEAASGPRPREEPHDRGVLDARRRGANVTLKRDNKIRCWLLLNKVDHDHYKIRVSLSSALCRRRLTDQGHCAAFNTKERLCDILKFQWGLILVGQVQLELFKESSVGSRCSSFKLP